MSQLLPDDPLLTTEQAALYIGCSPKTLHDMRFKGRGPRYAKLGGMVRYRRSLLEEWIEHSTRPLRASTKAEAA